MTMVQKSYCWLKENPDKIICFMGISVGIPSFYCSLLTLLEGEFFRGLSSLFPSIFILGVGLSFKSRNQVYEKTFIYLTFFLPWMYEHGTVRAVILAFALFFFLSWFTGFLTHAIALVLAWILLAFGFGVIALVVAEEGD